MAAPAYTHLRNCRKYVMMICRGDCYEKVTINLDDAVYQFYQKVGNSAQRPVEQVISDALFKLAGELSLEALHKKYKQG